MADLTEKQAGGSTKIIGANPTTGQETFWADVTSEGELKISSFANIDYQAASKTATTTESLVSVGGSNLTNRKLLVVNNKGPQDIFLGPTGVTTTNGITVEKDEQVTLAVGDNVDVYMITGSSSATVTIQEFS